MGDWTADEVVGALLDNVVNIKFIKIDGSVRKMRCTLKQDVAPPGEPAVECANNQGSNPEVISVWDLDKGQWRSFNINRLTTFVVEGDQQEG